MSSERVVELDLPWLPNPGAPTPSLWQNESQVVLAYRTAEVASGGPFAVVAFSQCLIATLGYPNDEALPGHPLYAAGLRYYGIYEVQDSSWIARLKQQNARSFPHARWWPDSPHVQRAPLRHLVITFHDSTFECLARHLSGSFATTADEVSLLTKNLITAAASHNAG